MHPPPGGPGAGPPFPPSAPGPPAGPQALRRDPPWRIWEAVAVLAAFFGTQLVVSGLAAVLARPFLSGEGEAGSDRVILLSLPAGLVASYVVGWLALVGLVRRRHHTPLVTALGLEPVPPMRLSGAFAGGMFVQILSAVLVALWPPPPEQEVFYEVFLQGGAWSLLFFFVVAVLLAPLMEEALFRGLLFPALRRRYGFLAAAAVVTALFAALHGFQTGLYWPALAGIALAGAALAWLRERTNALWHSVAFHVGFNLTAFLPLLFAERLPQQAWLTLP